MSEKEQAAALLEQVPAYKMGYVIAFLQGAILPDEVPNAETLAAIEELDNGGGTLFTGSTAELFAHLGGEG